MAVRSFPQEMQNKSTECEASTACAPNETKGKELTSSVAQRVQDVASDVGHKAQDWAANVANKAQETASAAVDKTNEGISSVTQRVQDVASDVGHKAQDWAANVANKAQETASAAVDKTNEGITAVGHQMSTLGGTVREAAPRSGMVGSVASTVADQLQAGGHYLEGHGLQDMGKDLTALVRHYPIQSVLVGIGIGCLLGMTLRRS